LLAELRGADPIISATAAIRNRAQTRRGQIVVIALGLRRAQLKFVAAQRQDRSGSFALNYERSFITLPTFNIASMSLKVSVIRNGGSDAGMSE
jgi:hypothetical protein